MTHNYYITTDATCDLPKQLYRDDFAVIPMSYVIDGTLYEGTPESSLDPHVFYDKMREGQMPTTSLINTQTAIDFFTPLLEKGYDVFHICFSSALSSTYKAMLSAKAELDVIFPDRKLYILDSKCASLGEGFLVYYCLKKRDEGLSLDELIAFAEEFKNVCHHDFSVDSLMHLHRGGRVSKTAAIVGTALQLKPVLITDTEGRLMPISKVVGRKAALKALYDKMVEKASDIDNSELVLIGHGDCPSDAQWIADKVIEHFGYKNVIIDYIGPVIGAHTGPNVIALFYIGKDKEK
jgi:EDD domain protein, DegV family